LICIVLDATRPLIHKKIIEKELEGFGIRLNKQPAEIEFKKRDKGGVTISRTVDTPNLDDDLIKVFYFWLEGGDFFFLVFFSLREISNSL